jgi:hypothetical protein
LGGKLPGSGNEKLFDPRCSSTRLGRFVASPGIGPEREVFVNERSWREVRRGEEAAMDVKKDKGVPRGWEFIIRAWSGMAEREEGSVSCMWTLDESERDLSCLRVEKTSGKEPVRPVFWIWMAWRDVRLPSVAGRVPADNELSIRLVLEGETKPYLEPDCYQ